ncbi:PREDICTED: uncharacterized protein LOC109114329 [Nelumbo nucifera]|nr:PREDICTED: uncharacterized protein LOC109114329 [Nelumbo nucifera]
MAVRLVAVLAYVVLTVVVVSVMEEAWGCGSRYGCFHVKLASTENQSRKLLHGSEEVFKSFRPLDSRRRGGNLVSWDLRRVPSGPDPLHHNGGSPKKPQTP